MAKTRILQFTSLRRVETMEKTVNVSPEIFEDDKIRYLFTFRNGDALFVFFLKVLCFCKKQNSNGALVVAGKHDTKTLSVFLGKKENFIKNAFALFSDIGLFVLSDNDTYIVKNWDKYQNGADDKFLEKQKKQVENRRQYMREYMKKQRGLNLMLTLTKTFKEKEEKEKEKKQKKKNKEVKENIHTRACACVRIEAPCCVFSERFSQAKRFYMNVFSDRCDEWKNENETGARFADKVKKFLTIFFDDLAENINVGPQKVKTEDLMRYTVNFFRDENRRERLVEILNDVEVKFERGDVGSKSSYLASVLYKIGKDYENSF